MAKPPLKTEYLYEYVIHAIQKGTYLHKPFPSERALAEETGMSLTTVRKVITRCLEEGVLRRHEKSRQPEIHPDYISNTFKKHVAVIMPPPSESTTEWCNFIEEECEEAQYSLTSVIYHGQEDPLIIKHINGPYDLIFFFPPHNPTQLLMQQMRINSERLIIFYHDYTPLGIATICDPPPHFTRTALEYLYDKGCRTISCLQASHSNRMIDNQVATWQAFLKEKKCQGELINCFTGTRSLYQRARIGTYKTLRQAVQLPDALICTTGLAAVGAIRGLADCSLRAGLDVKLLALSSNPLLKELTPSVTSMEPPDKHTVIKQAFLSPHPLRIEAQEAKLFIGESTEIGLRSPLPDPLPCDQ